MPKRFISWFTFAFAAMAVLATVNEAAARHRHRVHRHIVRLEHRHVVRQFVFPTPEAAQHVTGIGEFAGEFLPGLAGATTADPYRHPAYGYNQNSVLGPGYAYPGY